MNRDNKNNTFAALRVIDGAGRSGDAAKRMATAPLAALHANPVTKLCQRFATQIGSEDGSVVRLLRIVGINGNYGIEGELKGLPPHKSVHLHHETEPHQLAGYLHKEFAKARLLGVRDQLSDPAQSLYDELLYASSSAWANAAEMTKANHWTDPETEAPQVTFEIDNKALSLDFPLRQPDQNMTHLPLVLEGHMQGHLVREKDDLGKRMAQHAAGYTPEQAARDRYILSEVVLPTITFYPRTRESFLSDPKTYTEIDGFIFGTLDENRKMNQRKPGAAASRHPAERFSPTSQPSARVIQLRARPSGPESPT